MNAGHTRIADSFDVVKPFVDGNDHLKVSWNLCKVGSAACTLPDEGPQEKKDLCGSPRIQQALFDTCHKQKEQLVDEYAKAYAGYLEKLNEARKYLGDYQKTVLLCKAWDKTMQILIAAVGEADVEGLSPAAAKEMKEFRESM
jgi:hypothetical protein